MSTIVNVRAESAEELAALFGESGPGLTDRQMSRAKEPLQRLEVAPQVFQFRDLHHRAGAKEHHVRGLVRDLETQEGYFDPLLLFAVAGHRIVLDGHCRLQAYLRASLDPNTKVPVRYFRGSFSEALTCPASENAKAKLALTHKERLEAAWRLVLFDEERGNYSLRAVARAARCSKSTVGNMRQVLRDDEALDRDPRELSWKKVKQGLQEAQDIDPDWEEKIAATMRKRIRRVLGDKPNDVPQCLFRALEDGYPQIFPLLIPRHWAVDSGIVDELREESEDFDF